VKIFPALNRELAKLRIPGWVALDLQDGESKNARVRARFEKKKSARSAHRPYGKDAYRVERLLGTRLVGHCCIRWAQEVRSLALRRGMREMHSSGEATGRRHGGPLTAPFSLSCAPSGGRHPRPRSTRRWRPRFWPCEGPNRAGHHRSRVRR
jgi:hypothetical protein